MPNRRLPRVATVLSGLLALVVSGAVSALPVLDTDRATFEARLGTMIVDGYDTPLYPAGFNVLTDADMSARLGETRYQSTGFPNLNIVTDGHYCAGCNGSFLLDFTATSVGTSDGVYGVGLDVSGDEDVYGTVAFVTFGDGATANYAIPALSAGLQFWGLSSDTLIRTIHFGLADGGTNTSQSVQRMALDNLTIGSRGGPAPVAEPASLALLGLACGLVGWRTRRRG